MCAKSGTGPHGYFIPERGWVWEDFCTRDGYGDGDGDEFNFVGTGLGRQNPMGNSPLTSLVSVV
jgi:hypothetical protein